MAPTRKQIAEIRQQVERAYTEVRDYYEQTERESPEHFTKRSKKVALAQMRVHSGIYNRDYGEYKKGVKELLTYLNQLKDLRTKTHNFMLGRTI